jgi:hypothetical protein
VRGEGLRSLTVEWITKRQKHGCQDASDVPGLIFAGSVILRLTRANLSTFPDTLNFSMSSRLLCMRIFCTCFVYSKGLHRLSAPEDLELHKLQAQDGKQKAEETGISFTRVLTCRAPVPSASYSSAPAAFDADTFRTSVRPGARTRGPRRATETRAPRRRLCFEDLLLRCCRWHRPSQALCSDGGTRQSRTPGRHGQFKEQI